MVEYWDVQARCVLQLQELGYRYRLNDRIPIFKMWIKLHKQGNKNPKLRPTITRLLNDLDLLKELRLQALEPPLVSPTRYR